MEEHDTSLMESAYANLKKAKDRIKTMEYKNKVMFYSIDATGNPKLIAVNSNQFECSRCNTRLFRKIRGNDELVVCNNCDSIYSIDKIMEKLKEEERIKEDTSTCSGDSEHGIVVALS